MMPSRIVLGIILIVARCCVFGHSASETPSLATVAGLTAVSLIGLKLIFGVTGMLALGQAAFHGTARLWSLVFWQNTTCLELISHPTRNRCGRGDIAVVAEISSGFPGSILLLDAGVCLCCRRPSPCDSHPSPEARRIGARTSGDV